MTEPELLTDKPAAEPYHVNGEKRTGPKLQNRYQKATLDGHESLGRSKSSIIRDTLEIQRRMKERSLDPNTPAQHAAACARAFDALCERLRILRGQPLPGQLRPTGEPKSKGKRGSRGAEIVKDQAASGLSHATDGSPEPSKISPMPQVAEETVNTPEATDAK